MIWIVLKVALLIVFALVARLVEVLMIKIVRWLVRNILMMRANILLPSRQLIMVVYSAVPVWINVNNVVVNQLCLFVRLHIDEDGLYEY